MSLPLQNKPKGSEGLKKASIFAASLLISMLLAELLLRIWIRFPQQYYIWPPGTEIEFHPAAGLMPGISGISKFTINSQGFRGEEIVDDDRYNLLCLGGSTTECAFLDNDEAWPKILQDHLNASSGGQKYRVLNGGRSGLSLRHHLLQMEYLLKDFPEIDGVIILAGINDLLHNLDKGLPDATRAEILKEAFLEMPLIEMPPLNSRILYLLGKAREKPPKIPEALVQDEAGKVYNKWRKHRQMAKNDQHFVPLPNDSTLFALQKLDRIKALQEQYEIDVLMLTQPVLWHPEISEQARKLLWMGGTGTYQTKPGSAYFSVEDLAKGMKTMNDHLQKECLHQKLSFLDITEKLNGNEAIFYDDCHFNEKGAQEVARLVAIGWQKMTANQ